MSKIKGFDAGKIKIREIKALAGLQPEFSPFLDEKYKKEYSEKKLAILVLELLEENIQNAKIFRNTIAKINKSIAKSRERKNKELSDKNKELEEIRRLVNIKELKNIGKIIDKNKTLESENTWLKIENEKAKWAIDSVNNLTAERSKWLSKLKRAGIKV